MAGNGNGEEPKGGILSRLKKAAKSAVFVETPSLAAPGPAPDVPKPAMAAPVVKTAVATGQLDAETQEYQQMLWNAVTAKGSAYNTFNDMLDSFKDVIPDEKTRYKAALTAVSKQGITADQILKAIAVLLQSLESEHLRFEGASNEKQALLAEKEKELPAKDEQIAELKKQIEETTNKLRQQISNLESEKVEIRKTVETEKAKHDSIMSKLDVALNSLKNSLGNASVNVQKFLKGGE